MNQTGSRGTDLHPMMLIEQHQRSIRQILSIRGGTMRITDVPSEFLSIICKGGMPDVYVDPPRGIIGFREQGSHTGTRPPQPPPSPPQGHGAPVLAVRQSRWQAQSVATSAGNALPGHDDAGSGGFDGKAFSNQHHVGKVDISRHKPQGGLPVVTYGSADSAGEKRKGSRASAAEASNPEDSVDERSTGSVPTYVERTSEIPTDLVQVRHAPTQHPKLDRGNVVPEGDESHVPSWSRNPRPTSPPPPRFHATGEKSPLPCIPEGSNEAASSQEDAARGGRRRQGEGCGSSRQGRCDHVRLRSSVRKEGGFGEDTAGSLGGGGSHEEYETKAPNGWKAERSAPEALRNHARSSGTSPKHKAIASDRGSDPPLIFPGGYRRSYGAIASPTRGIVEGEVKVNGGVPAEAPPPCDPIAPKRTGEDDDRSPAFEPFTENPPCSSYVSSGRHGNVGKPGISAVPRLPRTDVGVKSLNYMVRRHDAPCSFHCWDGDRHSSVDSVAVEVQSATSSAKQCKKNDHIAIDDSAPSRSGDPVHLQSCLRASIQPDQASVEQALESVETIDSHSNTPSDVESATGVSRTEANGERNFILVRDAQSLRDAVLAVLAAKVDYFQGDAPQEAGTLKRALREAGTVALRFEGWHLGDPLGMVSTMQASFNGSFVESLRRSVDLLIRG